MPARRVLVVDDEPLSRWSVAERLRAEGCEVSEAGTGAEAVDRAEHGVDLVLLDADLPGGGLAAIERLRRVDPDLLAIVLTASRDASAAVDAMRAGAFDCAGAPVDLDDLALRVSRALETTRLRRHLRTFCDTLARPCGLDAIVGECEPIQRVIGLIRRAAGSPASTVLITGESGTGKDLVARVVHYASARATRPLLGITCSAMPDTLLESELFGHERGAFAGADEQKRGLFEQADEGTIFLDTIGEMAPHLQAKLLRVLEDRAFRRLGGAGDIRVDVRVIAATHRVPEELVKAATFREDLFYRLNVLRIELPPLRTRGRDVLLLARHFVRTFARELRRPARELSPAAEAALMAYPWPGNVRELRNVVERAVLICQSAQLEPADFDGLPSARAAASAGSGGFMLPPEGVSLEQVERSLVMQALERSGGNQTRAAALLSLHRDQIRYRVEKYGLKP